jgi:hypothetical protein
MKRHYKGFEFEHEITDDGKSVVICTKPGAGICGVGPTDEEAMRDYEEKTDELLPLRGYFVGLGNPNEPATFIPDTERHDDE